VLGKIMTFLVLREITQFDTAIINIRIIESLSLPQ